MYVKNMEWIGGKYRGNFKKMKRGGFLCRIMNNRIPYSKTLPSEEDAKKWLMMKSEEFGVTKNKYRIVDNSYLEVELANGQTFLCDIDDLKYVEEYVWGPNMSRYTYYVHGTVNGNEKKIFHRHIKPWGDGEEWDQVDHINGNGWDNRRSNLRDGSGNINNLNQKTRVDNVSGKVGIHYSNYDKSWTVQWQEDGKRRMKSFRVCDNTGVRKKGNYHKVSRTYEEAKEQAIFFREAKDLELGYTNGRPQGTI